MKKFLSATLTLSLLFAGVTAYACAADEHEALDQPGKCVKNPPVPKEEEDAQKRKNQREEGEKQKKQEKQEKQEKPEKQEKQAETPAK